MGFSMGYAHAEIAGFLARDAFVTTVKTSGMKMAVITVGVNSKYRTGKTDVDWFDILCFRTKAEFAEKYLKKGMLIIADLTPKTWYVNDSGGKKIKQTGFHVKGITILSKKGEIYESNDKEEEESNEPKEEDAPF